MSAFYFNVLVKARIIQAKPFTTEKCSSPQNQTFEEHSKKLKARKEKSILYKQHPLGLSSNPDLKPRGSENSETWGKVQWLQAHAIWTMVFVLAFLLPIQILAWGLGKQ